MQRRIGWSRNELLIAFKLYCEIPFGRLHSRNPEIISYAGLVGRTPSALAMKLTNIASLDPLITSTGRKGLTGASAADKVMWNQMQADWEGFAADIEHAEMVLHPSSDGTDMKTLRSIAEPAITDFTGRDRLIQTTARVGQDFFRRTVLSSYNATCCISGLKVPKLLVASHIVPWRFDPKNRLNPQNGLCLSTLHDRVFDLGIITIDEAMNVRLSKRYTSHKDTFFVNAVCAFNGKPIRFPEKFGPSQEFLEYHRSHVFEG